MKYSCGNLLLRSKEMKKMMRLPALLLAVALVLGLAGCPDDKGGDDPKDGDEFAKYYEPSYRGNVNGSVEVINPTQYDMLLFKNKTLIDNNIVGGVRNGETGRINFSDEKDYTVGGFKILYAVKQSEYKTAKGNSNVDYTAMVTYRNGSEFRITLISRYDGNYQFTSFNRNTDWPMELRKNTPEGEKIAFLAKGETWYKIKTTSTDLFTVYPVWIAFNTVSKAIVPFCPKDDILSVQTIQTVPPEKDDVPYYFPGGGTSTIKFDIDFSFATVQVQNNASLVAVFRHALAIQTPQSNFQGIRSGKLETYDIRSQGIGLDLNLAIGPMQNLRIPVRFQATPNENPVIENGWIYNVELNLKSGAAGDNVTDYTAWLVKGTQINQNQLLIAD